MDERQTWIRNRAYQLWEKAGRPNNMTLEFWLAAEHEHDHLLCLLSPGNCEYQETVPTTGGRHISLCHAPNPTCGHAIAYKKRKP